jgi:hypothetical protein
MSIKHDNFDFEFKNDISFGKYFHMINVTLILERRVVESEKLKTAHVGRIPVVIERAVTD